MYRKSAEKCTPSGHAQLDQIENGMTKIFVILSALLREGPLHFAGSTIAAGECTGPFDRLRAGSSARKHRGPQDDKLKTDSSSCRSL